MLNPIPYAQDPAQYLNQGIAGLIFSSFTPGQNGADTTEDTLQSFTLPAGLLVPSAPVGQRNPPEPSRGLRLRAWGVTANNADTKTLRLYHGALVFSQALTVSTANAWFAELELIRSGNSAQIARFLVTHGAAVLTTQQSTAGADNLANSLIAKVTGQAGTGNAGDIICNCALVELLV